MQNHVAKLRAHLVFDALVLAFFAWSFFESTGFSPRARELPLLVSSLGLLLGLYLLSIHARAYIREERGLALSDAPASREGQGPVVGTTPIGADVSDSPVSREVQTTVAGTDQIGTDLAYDVNDYGGPAEGDVPRKRLLVVSGWIAGYLVSMWLFGFLVVSAVFVALCLRIEARAPIVRAVISGVLVGIFVYGFNNLLSIRTPESVLSEVWPF